MSTPPLIRWIFHRLVLTGAILFIAGSARLFLEEHIHYTDDEAIAFIEPAKSLSLRMKNDPQFRPSFVEVLSFLGINRDKLTESEFHGFWRETWIGMRLSQGFEIRIFTSENGSECYDIEIEIYKAPKQHPLKEAWDEFP